MKKIVLEGVQIFDGIQEVDQKKIESEAIKTVLFAFRHLDKVNKWQYYVIKNV